MKIREFEYSPEAQESRKQELEKLVQDQESFRSSLLQWSYASYAEVASSSRCYCKNACYFIPFLWTSFLQICRFSFPGCTFVPYVFLLRVSWDMVYHHRSWYISCICSLVSSKHFLFRQSWFFHWWFAGICFGAFC